MSQAVASYLPPPDAPDYAEYEKAEDEYLKGLEVRYPQVCQRCEPKVQERIRAAGYAAKTDHLRRMMDRTRGRGIQYRDANWGGPLVILGGAGWFLSIAGQILWDGLSLFEPAQDLDGLRDEQHSASGSVCLQQVMRGSGSISDCTGLLYSAAGLALLIGVLSSWWNPMLQETLKRRGVRAVGTAEFYQLQSLLLVIRCATWWYLPGYDLSAHKTRATHIFLLVLTVIVSIQPPDMDAEANSFPDKHCVFSLRWDGLFGSNQISGQSRAFDIADDSAESVWREVRRFWSHPSTAESTRRSQRWWYTAICYYGLGNTKSASSTCLPATYASTGR